MTNDPLAETAKLAGFFAAHAIWSLSGGEPLPPLYGFLRQAGLREFTRLEQPTLEAGIAAGRELLEHNAAGALCAVLVFDGRVTLAGGAPNDAVVVEGRCLGEGQERLEMIIPYRPAHHAEGFAVHRPKFVDLPGAGERSLRLSQDFFRGVNEHREAAPIWRDHFDDRR